MLNSAALVLTIIKENPSAMFFDEFLIQPKFQKWYGWHLNDNHMLSGSTQSHFKWVSLFCFSGTGKFAIKGNKSGTISEMIAVSVEEIIENLFDNNDPIN